MPSATMTTSPKSPVTSETSATPTSRPTSTRWSRCRRSLQGERGRWTTGSVTGQGSASRRPGASLNDHHHHVAAPLLTTVSSPALTSYLTTGCSGSSDRNGRAASNLAPGTYYIGGIANYDDAIAESNEDQRRLQRHPDHGESACDLAGNRARVTASATSDRFCFRLRQDAREQPGFGSDPVP